MTDSRVAQGRRRMAAALALTPLLAPLAPLSGLLPARSWAADAGAAASDYPRKPIKIAIGFAPGGSTDAPMRVLGEQVARILGQPIVIENKPGAGGVLGVQGIISARPMAIRWPLRRPAFTACRTRRTSAGARIPI